MTSLFDSATIDARFREFDRAHPDVWRLFRQFALELLQAGREHYSADAILHRIRWHFATSGKCHDGFKMNNNFSSRYARKLAAEDERFRGFFEFRRLKSA